MGYKWRGDTELSPQMWLWGIIVNLLLQGYFDIALRDLGLSLGALALARLSQEFDSRPLGI